jgi:SsrA-binding protein
MAPGKKKEPEKGKGGQYRLIADNRRARYNFFIDEVIEAGIILTGTEVKSLRDGHATIAESYASEENGELFLINANIPIYSRGNRFNHEPKRHRKLLLKKRQVNHLLAGVNRKGMTIVPLKLYFNEHGKVKIEVGLAKGKQNHDKRQTDKDRSWNRDKARLMREKG